METKTINVSEEQYAYIKSEFSVLGMLPSDEWERRAKIIREYLTIEPGMYKLVVGGREIAGVLGV